MIITIGRKPFKGSLIDNVRGDGCGGLNIKDTRIGTEGGRTNKGGYQDFFVGGTVDYTVSGVDNEHTPKGRWAANVVISEGVVKILDEQSGVSVSTGGRIGNAEGAYAKLGASGYGTGHVKGDGGFGDVGGASRYFKVIK